MRSREDPIGVFDSGVGGISALQAMVSLLPMERFLYYGDIAHAPYGTKGTEEVIRLTRRVTDHLMAQGIKALVIACNTATGAAAAVLRKELTIPVIGMEPALKPASEARKGGKILVLATPLTLKQEKFRNLMARFGEGAEPVPCDGLMDLVEREDAAGARRYLEALFTTHSLDGVDAVVLGCTHYVFLKKMIREMIPDRVILTEGSLGTARQLRRVLEREGLLREAGQGGVVFESSGGSESLETMERWLARESLE